MGKRYWGFGPYGFQYDLSRLRTGSILELLSVYIFRRGRRFQVMYNQIGISPSVDNLNQLHDVDDIPFRIPPASATQLEIPPSRWLGEPFWPPPYKVPRWRLWLGVGVQQSVSSTITRMIRDLNNFERFASYWEKTRTRITINVANERA